MTGIPAEASKQYSAAYKTHYTEQDFHLAFCQYVDLIDCYPSSLEANYARTQIENIVKVLIPDDELLSALVLLLEMKFASMNS
jgi:hypothetical protein